jgi:hypothetical protein
MKHIRRKIFGEGLRNLQSRGARLENLYVHHHAAVTAQAAAGFGLHLAMAYLGNQISALCYFSICCEDYNRGEWSPESKNTLCASEIS